MVASDSKFLEFLSAFSGWLTQAKENGFTVRPRENSISSPEVRADQTVRCNFELDHTDKTVAKDFLRRFSASVRSPFRANLVRDHHVELEANVKHSSGSDSTIGISIVCHSQYRVSPREKSRLTDLQRMFRG